MILQALTRYYEDLLTRGEIAAPGWSPAKISFALCLDENGAVILDSVYDTIDILSMDRYWVRMGDDYALLDGSGSALVKLSNYSRLMD